MNLGGKSNPRILFHWDFLLEIPFLLSLGREELEATHWSSSCSALSHVAYAPHRTILFFITCFSPSLTGKQEAFMRPWWELTVGKPYDKRLCRNSELKKYKTELFSNRVSQWKSHKQKFCTISLFLNFPGHDCSPLCPIFRIWRWKEGLARRWEKLALR